MFVTSAKRRMDKRENFIFTRFQVVFAEVTLKPLNTYARIVRFDRKVFAATIMPFRTVVPQLLW